MPRTLAASLLLLTLTAPLPAAGAEAPAYPDPERWAEDMRAFREADASEPPPQGAIVFVGSSSIRMWHETLAEDMMSLTVVPRGFGGSTMEDVRYHLETLVLRHRPRAVVLYEGDNDVGEGLPASRILETFHELVAELHATLPETRLYVLSVKPSPVRWHLWPVARLTNHLLRLACERDARLTYVDLATPLLGPDGRPRGELFLDDELHLNERGYAVWKSVLQPLLLDSEGRFEPAGAGGEG
jgi:lysophospholipase L1-like esterase